MNGRNEKEFYAVNKRQNETECVGINYENDVSFVCMEEKAESIAK